MRWYSSTVKRRVLRGMTILSILLGESCKCPASSSIESKIRRTVIGTLQAGAVYRVGRSPSPEGRGGQGVRTCEDEGGQCWCSLFNILTDRELATKFGPCSVPEPLGEAARMTTQHDSMHRRPVLSPGATAHRALRTLLVGGLLSGAPPLASQVPSPAQAQSALQQAVQRNP